MIGAVTARSWTEAPLFAARAESKPTALGRRSACTLTVLRQTALWKIDGACSAIGRPVRQHVGIRCHERGGALIGLYAVRPAGVLHVTELVVARLFACRSRLSAQRRAAPELRPCPSSPERAANLSLSRRSGAVADTYPSLLPGYGLHYRDHFDLVVAQRNSGARRRCGGVFDGGGRPSRERRTGVADDPARRVTCLPHSSRSVAAVRHAGIRDPCDHARRKRRRMRTPSHPRARWD